MRLWLINPTVIVEVLSDSTEAYDRGRKFENYRQMPSLREYLLVSQKEPRIEQFVRQESGQWLLREAAGLDAALDLPSLEIQISLLTDPLAGYARRSRLVWAKNPWPRTSSYLCLRPLRRAL